MVSCFSNTYRFAVPQPLVSHRVALETSEPTGRGVRPKLTSRSHSNDCVVWQDIELKDSGVEATYPIINTTSEEAGTTYLIFLELADPITRVLRGKLLELLRKVQHFLEAVATARIATMIAIVVTALAEAQGKKKGERIHDGRQA